jgi:hypothetical protein
MSTIKADAVPRQSGGVPGRLKRLLEPERIDTAGIKTGPRRKMAIAGRLVKFNRPGIVLADLESHGLPTPSDGRFLGCGQKCPAKPAPSKFAVDGNCIKMRGLPVFPVIHEYAPCYSFSILRDK